MKPSRVRWICSGLNRLVVVPAVVAAAMLLGSTASAQLYTTTSATTTWTTSRWSSNPAGPFTTAWTSGSDVSFADNSTYNFLRFATGSGTTTIGNLTTGTNTTVSITNSAGQKMEFGGATKTFNIGQGSLVNFGSVALQDTGTAANGFTKSGLGTLVFSGGTYTGPFTLSAGNIVASGNNLFGQGTVTINGGAIGSSTGNFAMAAAPSRSAINIGGDFQLGLTGTVGGNSESAGFTFANAGGAFDLTGGTRKITVGSSGTVTINTAISNGGLTLATIDGGTGQFRLSGTNTYAGGTEIRGSTLTVITSNAALGTGTVTLSGTSAATLNIANLNLANNFTIANSTGTKTIATSGGGNATTISGTINNLDSTGGLTIGALAAKTINLGAIVGTGTKGITFGSSLLSGTVNLTGTTSFAGDTRIDSSMLMMGTGLSNILSSGSGAGNIVFQGSGSAVLNLRGTTQTVNGLDDSALAGTILSSVGTLSTLNVGANNTTSSFQGLISSNIALRKIGTGTLSLTGSNSYTGGNTIDAGTLQGNVNSIQGNVANSGVLAFTQTSSGTYSGIVSGTGSLLKLGGGDLTLTGTNTFSGGTVLSAGNLIGTVGTLQGNVAAAAGTLVKFNQATSGTYGGVISGNGGLSLLGTGTVKLGSSQAYTGATSVDAGTLILAGNLASGTTTIASGATLGGSGILTGGLSVNGSLKPGESAPGSLAAAGITLGGSSSTTMNIAGSTTAGTDYDTVIAASGLKYDGNLALVFDNSTAYGNYTTFNLFQAGAFDATANSGKGFAGITVGGSGPYSGLTFTYYPAGNGNPGGWATNQSSGNQYLLFTPSTGTLVIVPEPSTWAMALASVGFAGFMARRKRLARKRRMA